jgi:hypothetical protein
MKGIITGLNEFHSKYFCTHQELFERLSHSQNPEVLAGQTHLNIASLKYYRGGVLTTTHKYKITQATELFLLNRGSLLT